MHLLLLCFFKLSSMVDLYFSQLSSVSYDIWVQIFLSHSRYVAMWKLNIDTGTTHNLYCLESKIYDPCAKAGPWLAFVNTCYFTFDHDFLSLISTDPESFIISQDLQQSSMPGMFIYCLYKRSLLTLVMICTSESHHGNYIISHAKHSLQSVII